MPDTATQAASTPAAPVAEPKAAPLAEKSAVTPPSAESKPAAQPPVQEPPKPTEDERRAQRIAAAKREAARVSAIKENLEREKASHAEEMRLAGEYRRLAALQKADPLRYLDEVGLKVSDVSKLYLEKQTGVGKSPEQIAEEVYARREAERNKTTQAEQQKLAEAKAIQDREAAYAGSKATLGNMIAGDPKRFELCGKLIKEGLGDVAVDKAFRLVEDYYRETKVVLDFGKALDAVEAKFKSALAKSEEIVQPEKVKAEAKTSGSKSAPKVEADVSEVKPSNPQPIRRMTPRDQKRIAKELVMASLAAKDT